MCTEVQAAPRGLVEVKSSPKSPVTTHSEAVSHEMSGDASESMDPERAFNDQELAFVGSADVAI